ncbi:PHD finger protein 6 [Mactra antiquata]
MDDNKCGFCHTGIENESICGTLHKDKLDGKAVCAHHKCMQYSALLVQYRDDSFGGFKKQEVMKEIKRGSRLFCSLCKIDKTKKNKKGATSGCAWASCKKSFHYLCVSMNPKTVAKRYRVAAGDKEVILYRVFCCQDHETKYRENLSAEDVVGKNQSSDDDVDDDLGSVSNDDKSSESELEPPTKKSKVEKDYAESGISSPGMTTEEVVSETQRQYESLIKQKDKDRSKNDVVDSAGNESTSDITEDLDTSKGNEDSEHDDSSGAGHIVRNLNEGFHIIIPSKLEIGDKNTLCKKAGYSRETCTLWPKGYCRKGLQDRHMPFIMWNLASKLSGQDSEEFVKTLSCMSSEQYESLFCLYEDIDNRHVIETKLIHLAEDINSKYKSEVCSVTKLNNGGDNFYIMVLSLPKTLLEMYDVWSLVNVYKWSKHTVAPVFESKSPCHSYEKRVLLNWLLPRLHNKSCDISIYPQEEALRLDHGHKYPSVAREIEFRLETISQSLLSKDLVKILVLRKVNRNIVNFKQYLQQTIALFFTKNADCECYMIVDVWKSDGIHTLNDIIPQNVGTIEVPKIIVYSGTDPSIRTVSCLVLYSSEYRRCINDLNSQNSIMPECEEFEDFSLYLDVDDSPEYPDYSVI